MSITNPSNTMVRLYLSLWIGTQSGFPGCPRPDANFGQRD